MWAGKSTLSVLLVLDRVACSLGVLRASNIWVSFLISSCCFLVSTVRLSTGLSVDATAVADTCCGMAAAPGWCAGEPVVTGGGSGEVSYS